MNKLKASQILKKDVKHLGFKLSATDETVQKLITETKQLQENVLKLKEVDQDRLRMVVQL